MDKDRGSKRQSVMQNLGIQAYEDLALRNMRSSGAELYRVDNTETSYQIL